MLFADSKHDIFQFFLQQRRHDAGMLWDSQLLQSLQMFALDLHGQPMCIYGETAYPLEDPPAGTFLQSSVNSSNAGIQFSNEWSSFFCGVVVWGHHQLFQVLGLQKKNLKIGLSIVGKMYVVCAILRNVLTWLYGNQTSEFFELDPPSLQDYIA